MHLICLSRDVACTNLCATICALALHPHLGDKAISLATWVLKAVSEGPQSQTASTGSPPVVHPLLQASLTFDRAKFECVPLKRNILKLGDIGRHQRCHRVQSLISTASLTMKRCASTSMIGCTTGRVPSPEK